MQAINLKWNQLFSETQSTGLNTSTQVSAQYTTENRVDLEYTFAVAHQVLCRVADRKREDQSDLLFNGASMLEDASAFLRYCNTQIEFQLKLAEAVAVHQRNFGVLEAVILAFFEESKTDFCERAASMLESFCSLCGSVKHAFDLGSPGMLMEDDYMMQRIFRLVKDLGDVANKSEVKSQLLARICTTFEKCDTAENMKLVSQSLLKSILSPSRRFSDRSSLPQKRDLGCVLGRMGAE